MIPAKEWRRVIGAILRPKDDDEMAVALLAVARAAPYYDPARGKPSTFMIVCARRELSRYRARERARMAHEVTTVDNMATVEAEGGDIVYDTPFALPLLDERDEAYWWTLARQVADHVDIRGLRSWIDFVEGLDHSMPVTKQRHEQLRRRVEVQAARLLRRDEAAQERRDLVRALWG